jgi:hypothetical protein
MLEELFEPCFSPTLTAERIEQFNKFLTSDCPSCGETNWSVLVVKNNKPHALNRVALRCESCQSTLIIPTIVFLLQSLNKQYWGN